MKILDLAGIPRNQWDAKLSKIPSGLTYFDVVSDFCKNICKNVRDGKGLYLHGDYSTGKSAIASIVLKAALNSRISECYWVRAKELPGIQIEKTTNQDGDSYFEILRNATLLVIDEFQVREDIKYTESLFEDVTRYRIDQKLSTIITTNVAIRELERRYPALYAVLQEAVTPVKVYGHDFRKPMKGNVNV